jgi:hypothetical protein
VLSSDVKCAKTEADRSPPSIAKAGNVCRYTLTDLCFFLKLVLLMQREIFIV